MAPGRKIYVSGVGECTFIRTEREGYSRVLHEKPFYVDYDNVAGYEQQIFIVKNGVIRSVDEA